MHGTQDWVPDWARRVVWYQIFPERFRNGDAANDPTLADIAGAWPHDQISPWQVHPWTADWYALQPYEEANGRGIWYNLIRRRYGGDLQGIIDKLDYLQQDLGVTALYLTPIFESPSHHKYDGVVYHHIDGTLGPDPAGDRALMAREDPADPATWRWTAADRLALELIRQAHSRGLRIIFDGVFNHISSHSPFFRDVAERQQRSRFRDWFKIEAWDDPDTGTRFTYRGWWGVPELPEWRQDADGIVAGPRDYIFASTQRWMAPHGDPAEGIDGWRLDVAYCVAHPFWKRWRAFVKRINPEAYLTAEVIDANDALRPYLQGDEFDAVMNYNVGFACAEYFINRAERITTTRFDALLRDLRDAFPPAVAYVQQNLVDSHDANRMASHIVNPDGVPYRAWRNYHAWSKAGENPGYDTRKPTPAEYEIQKLIALFLMTYVGAPVIYYGDEVGMWGANDPCCRKPMVWADLAYEPEAWLPNGTRRTTPDPVAVNHDLLATYKRLISLRNRHPALSLGDFTTLLADDARQIYAYRRAYEDQVVIVALNNTRQAQRVELPADGALPPWPAVMGRAGPADGPLIDALDEGAAYAVQGGRVAVTLRPLWGVALLGQIG